MTVKRNPCVCDYNTYGTHTQACYDHQYAPEREERTRRINKRYIAERAVLRAAQAWRKAGITGDVVAEEVAAVELRNALLDLDLT